jgi:uncharacterized integral membrane protein (TIGR00698 family)
MPGFMLCAVLAGIALTGARALPSHPLVPDVLLALFCGALVANTPLKRLLGREPEKGCYEPGLRFVGRNVLRIAVVLMGLKIQARFFELNDVFVVFCAIAVAMPTTFFLTHTVAIYLKVSRRLTDVIAAGTMICGASAVNAIAPVVGVTRQEQGIALGTVFMFSVVALLLFHPIAAALGMPTVEAGLWGGLAVNDLSSAVAVGAQMGPGGAEIAAASKSARIVLLAPLLVAFSIGRRAKSSTPGLRRPAFEHLPVFVAGFVALAVARALGDRFFAAAPLWSGVLATDRVLVDVAMMMVSAGIGLHLEIRGLLAVGARALLLGLVAACSMAALTLELVMLGRQGGVLSEMPWGAVVVAGSYIAYRATTRSPPKPGVSDQLCNRKKRGGLSSFRLGRKSVFEEY